MPPCRDPSDPPSARRHARPDNLHPELLGYEVMANTVSLAMLETALPGH